MREDAMLDRDEEPIDVQRDAEDEPASLDPEVPEADALEQSRGTQPPAEEDPDAVGDAPEADALEQARGAGLEHADEER
jgi:hypothetical protein